MADQIWEFDGMKSRAQVCHMTLSGSTKAESEIPSLYKFLWRAVPHCSGGYNSFPITKFLKVKVSSRSKNTKPARE